MAEGINKIHIMTEKMTVTPPHTINRDFSSDWLSMEIGPFTKPDIILDNKSTHIHRYLHQIDLDRERVSYIELGKNLLDEIRNETRDAYQLDDKIDKIPEMAYDDAMNLLEDIYLLNIPIPEFGWAEDGSLSFTWFLNEGSATVGLYGDNIAIFSIYFEEKRQIEGVCELLDAPMLYGFFRILANIYLNENLEIYRK